MFELRDRLRANAKVIMRVTRTTLPYGLDEVILCHPYPLWVKDARAKVHHGSLLIDVTNQVMHNQLIRYGAWIF